MKVSIDEIGSLLDYFDNRYKKRVMRYLIRSLRIRYRKLRRLR